MCAVHGWLRLTLPDFEKGPGPQFGGCVGRGYIFGDEPPRKSERILHHRCSSCFAVVPDSVAPARWGCLAARAIVSARAVGYSVCGLNSP